ncbi:hypothetical protein SeMB42_g06874 [Synchytrium endobioticum]|uniref:Uncharacterized protein n=1 Tax=Synchytrium endobioticum TaxID=286115 RepID=A0A507CJ44_9FUNG|nr:hypothetical protein SeMB42_g06874 [Synchytrium endobioticum]
MSTGEALDLKDAPVPPQMDQIKSLLGGGFGGVGAVLAGHPFDTLKVRLQTSSEYKGLIDCFRKTVARDGMLGLYKGMSSPLIGVTPMFALSFWSYDVGQALVYSLAPKRESKDLTMAEFAIAGGFSAIPTTAITTPMERVKVVLQTQDQMPAGSKRYKGMFDAGAGMIREGGVGSLYRGTIATLARDIPGSAAYFVAYEAVYRALKPKGQESMSIGAVLFAGGMAGVAMWSIAIPPDVLKSKIQAAPAGTYSGFGDALVKTVRTEGPGALFKGLGPALLRAFPANAAAFLFRAAALDVMHKLW